MYYLCFSKGEEPKFLSAGRFVAVSPNLHQKRKLNEAVLMLGFDGECPLAQDGREYILKKGNYMLCFPSSTHYGTAPSTVGQSHFWCHFHLPQGFFVKEAESIDELLNEDLCVIPEFSQISDCEKFFVLFSQIIDAAENDSPNSIIRDCYLKILLCSLADDCLHSRKEPKKKIAAVRIKEWLELHDYKNVSVSRIAHELGYNPNYMARLIKGETELTPIEYINTLKLRRAKNFLLNSNMKISEIAFCSGFTDEKYFIKVFKKYENVTPSGFRKTYFRRNINAK